MSKERKTSETSNITSSYLAAGFFGSLLSWPLSEWLGRKRAIQVTSSIFIIGAVVMTATTSSLAMIYVGRVLTGLGVGALTGIIPSYIAEVAPPAIRGQLTGYFDVSYNVGSVCGFWINYGINQNMDPTQAITFRIPIAMQIVPGGLLALGSFFLTESPTLLIRKGKREQAMKNLTYLRQLPEDHQYMLEEVGMIEARLAEQAELARGKENWRGVLRGAFNECKVPSIRYRL